MYSLTLTFQVPRVGKPSTSGSIETADVIVVTGLAVDVLIVGKYLLRLGGLGTFVVIKTRGRDSWSIIVVHAQPPVITSEKGWSGRKTYNTTVPGMYLFGGGLPFG